MLPIENGLKKKNYASVLSSLSDLGRIKIKAPASEAALTDPSLPSGGAMGQFGSKHCAPLRYFLMKYREFWSLVVFWDNSGQR